MLQIIVKGQSIDLLPDTSFNLIIENPFLLADRIPVPYTTNFDIPATAQNLDFFKYPNRINTNGVFKEYSTEVFFGPVKLLKGYLVVKEFDIHIKAFFRAVEFTDNLAKNLFDIEFTHYNFGNSRLINLDFDDPNDLGGKYANHIKDKFNDENAEFALAPIKIKTEENPTTLGLQESVKQYFNNYDAKFKSFVFKNANFHGTIFPMPFVYYLINTIFGNTLINNPFANFELKKLVIPTFYHPKFSLFHQIENQGVLLDNYLDPPFEYSLKDFMADKLANDFLKDLFKLFSCSLLSNDGKFEIKFSKDIINSKLVENWTDKLIEQLSISLQEKQDFKYGYTDYQTIKTPTTLFDLENILALKNTEVPESTIIPDYEANFKIAHTAQVYSIKNGESKKNLLLSGLEPNTIPKNGFDNTCNLSPLPMQLQKYWWRDFGSDADPNSTLELKDWFVPVYEADKRFDRPDKLNIMIYQGLTDAFVNGHRYPYLTCFDVDAFGRVLGDLTLRWEGENGILNRYHKEFKAWVEKEKIRITGTFLLDALDIKNLNLTIRKSINNRNFFIERLQIPIKTTHIEPAEVTLIEDIDPFTPSFVYARIQSFTRNNCNSGFDGSGVTFVKKYYSNISQQDAINQANADATYTSEGQAYANNNGICYNPAFIYSSFQPVFETINLGVSNSFMHRTRGKITLTAALEVQTRFTVTIYVYNGTVKESVGTIDVWVAANTLTATSFSYTTHYSTDGNPRYAEFPYYISPNPAGGQLISKA